MKTKCIVCERKLDAYMFKDRPTARSGKSSICSDCKHDARVSYENSVQGRAKIVQYYLSLASQIEQEVDAAGTTSTKDVDVLELKSKVYKNGKIAIEPTVQPPATSINLIYIAVIKSAVSDALKGCKSSYDYLMTDSDDLAAVVRRSGSEYDKVMPVIREKIDRKYDDNYEGLV